SFDAENTSRRPSGEMANETGSAVEGVFTSTRISGGAGGECHIWELFQPAGGYRPGARGIQDENDASSSATRKSLLLTSKSEMLTRKSLLLTSKSEMLARKSLFLIPQTRGAWAPSIPRT